MSPEYTKAARELRAASEIEQHLVASLGLVREQKYQLQQLVADLYAKDHSVTEPA